MAIHAHKTGLIAFEDGTVFKGRAFGASKTVTGEAVFNTSLTGYQEMFTDPSYHGQILTLTAPQIGNYGITLEDAEASMPYIQGVVVRELSPITSNWRASEDLHTYLVRMGVPGLEGIDTRSITKKLRYQGALKCCLTTEALSAQDAIEKARSSKALKGQDYVQAVSCKTAYDFHTDAYATFFSAKGSEAFYPTIPNKKHYHVAAFDFGAKNSIFKKLTHYGFKVTVVPASESIANIQALKPDCLFLSNGPGDPAAATYAHKTLAALIPHYPTFGICMGHQILTHALGASTFKLKFGHRGANQPVKNLETGKVVITTQNHGFASDPDSLDKAGAIITETNLNDHTVEGLRHAEFPIFSVQYHPEACAGPNDTTFLFQEFYNKVSEFKAR